MGTPGHGPHDALADPTLAMHRGSQRSYLPAAQTEPVLAYLRGRGVTARTSPAMVGDGRWRSHRAGSARCSATAGCAVTACSGWPTPSTASSCYGVLAEDVWYDKVASISAPEWADVYDIEVDEHHTFVANDVVVANCSPPFRQAEFDIMYGKGISREGSLLDMAVDLGIVKKSGAWFTYEGEQLGQGRENAKEFLADNPEIMVEISDKVLTMAGLRPDEREEASGAAGVHARRRRPDRARLTRPAFAYVCRRQALHAYADRRETASQRDRSLAGLEYHQPEQHDEAEVGDPDAGAEHRAGGSLVSVSDGRMRNQLTTTRPTHKSERGDDPAVGDLEHLVGHPDHAHAEHPHEHEGRQPEAKVPPGDLGAGFVDSLIAMGARVVLCDPHRAVVIGPSRLHGATIVSPDIRAGMAMIAAALCAEGRSVIHNVRQVDRGYERVDERLRGLGAHIERERD